MQKNEIAVGSDPFPARKPETRTFTALNGLRFLAAMGVVIFHYSVEVRGYYQLPPFLQKLCHEGPVAVPFFFILSGFVLSLRYLNPGPSDSLREFYVSRFSRLYPAYIFAFFLFMPFAVGKYLGHSAGARNPETFFLAAGLGLLMLQAWTPYSQSWNGPSWSLSVEAFMYVIFPWALARIRRLSDRGAVVLIALAWVLPVGVAVAATIELVPNSIWTAYVQNNPLLWTPLFLMGIAGVRFLDPWMRLPRKQASAATYAACLALVSLAMLWPRAWAEVYITGGIAPLFLLLIVCFTRNTNWLVKRMGGRVFDTLGRASYIIYIVQAPAWHYWQGISNLLRKVPARTQIVELWQFLLFLPILIVFSLAVERFVEVPARRLLQKMARREVSIGADIPVASAPEMGG